MSRSEMLEWIDAGRVAPEHQPRALRVAGMIPAPADWRAFLGQLSLWLGTIALANAVIFFFAFNWDDLARMGKFALVEAAIVAALVALWRVDLNGLAGKAVLLTLCLLTGALLALTGQVYQTGADTFELFAWWAVLILPWVAIGRFSPLWLLWLGLLNLAVMLHVRISLNEVSLFWSLFGLNTLALVAWEAGRRAGIAWLQDSWAPRLVAIASGFMATLLMVWAITGGFRDDRVSGLAMLAYVGWAAALYFWYRRVRLDPFMLAGGLLSLIVVVVAVLGDNMLDKAEAGGFLFIGLVVIGMSAGGAIWLKRIVKEQRG
jgi:uncharacterized membrane protein